ncbi:zinc-finger-containing protein [Scytonema sp. UIC 10036]|uniref:zinc-finger-containing protein n=1 Tax=Scytonema sp. UIC 10036 TaxID=2304196 RepID=UPI001A9BEE07|nr:zinc-finger-containing protein [Scytonema sp. UIC 10036]
MNCPYCVRSVSDVDASVVYRVPGYGRLWLCDRYPVCDAYVGAHPQSNAPKGTLANRQLVTLATKCSRLF